MNLNSKLGLTGFLSVSITFFIKLFPASPENANPSYDATDRLNGLADFAYFDANYHLKMKSMGLGSLFLCQHFLQTLFFLPRCRSNYHHVSASQICQKTSPITSEASSMVLLLRNLLTTISGRPQTVWCRSRSTESAHCQINFRFFLFCDFTCRLDYCSCWRHVCPLRSDCRNYNRLFFWCLHTRKRLPALPNLCWIFVQKLRLLSELQNSRLLYQSSSAAPRCNVDKPILKLNAYVFLA